MPSDTEGASKRIEPWARVAVLVTALLTACWLARELTGEVLPTRPQDALIFQNALLLIVLGSAIIEHKFTKPADSLVNALMGIITLLTVYGVAPRGAWWAVFSYCALVFLAASVCVSLSTGRVSSPTREKLIALTYRIAVVLGRARIIYSVVFLFGVFTFYGVQSTQTVALVVFWGLFLAIWPLGLPEVLSALGPSVGGPREMGTVIRTEWPNIIRVAIAPASKWTPQDPKQYQQADGAQKLVIPLYSESQGEVLVGTGLCVKSSLPRSKGLMQGRVYEIGPTSTLGDSDIAVALGGEADSQLIGFVVEDSAIAEIRFEVWGVASCREGSLVWADVGGDKVYYQVVNGVDREESFESNRRGFQIAVAVQVGVLNSGGAFTKCLWLPLMNTPVFTVNPDFDGSTEAPSSKAMLLGHIPNTRVPVHISLDEALDHHTAILGVTGSGKTELALDMIRAVAATGTKVICVDLTARYSSRLSDLSPTQLSIDDAIASELSEKLFAVETGPYGGASEKRPLREFGDKLKANVATLLKAFLETKDGANIGIVSLPEISNTRATIYITELYLSLVLRYAKKYSPGCPRILIVLEEAHTVIPEAATMGLADFDSKGLVGKIAQVALQGRKYRVGLLVIAQRTATVSKTVLTQCNTIISFACIDDTSLNFLSNVFGSAYVALIPNLPPLHAVAFGKGLKSQRPLVLQVPFVEGKVQANP